MLNTRPWQAQEENTEPGLADLTAIAQIFAEELPSIEPEVLSSVAQEIEEEESNLIDPMDIYLKEINHTPLLSKLEEIELGRLVQQGNKTAKDHMIKSNLRLVVKIARRYVRSNMPILDLIEEGNLGLIKAVEKFDPERGFRFSTYGAWWIQQNIERAIMSQNRTIRLPVHIMKKLNACLRVGRDLAKNLDHEPNAKEIATKMGKPLQEIESLLALNEKIISIDNYVSDDINKPLVDILVNESNDPAEIIAENNLKDSIEHWLLLLHPMQREVLEYRFGLNGKEETTLEQTGIEVGVTRERVRQLQLDGLKNLKNLIIKSGNHLANLLK